MMKSKWQAQKLSEILKVRNGYAFDSKSFSNSGGLPLIRIRDLKNGTTTEINYVGIYDKKFEVKAGDFLIGMDGEFGCYEWKGEIALLNQRVCRLQDFKGLDAKFLFYGINKYLKEIEDFTSFTTVKHISSKQIENIEFYYPESQKEQKRIVGILDEVFEGVAKAKENVEGNLRNVSEVFEAYLQSVFADPKSGWEVKKLKELTTKIGSGATPSGGEKSYKLNGVSLIRSLNVHDSGFRKKKLAFLDDEQASKLSNVSVQVGDILLNITGASVARCCIAPPDFLPARVNQHVSIIRLIKEKIDPEFLCYALVSKTYKDKLLRIGEGGATRQAITKTQIENFSIKYPKLLSEQKSVITKLEIFSTETKKLEAIYKTKLNHLEELKKSILKKAFNGEL